MMISPQDLISIGTTVTLGTQIAKKALPGDYDAWGVEICGVISTVAVACWLAQSTGSLGSRDSFDILTLWLEVFGAATGIYTTAKMATAPTPDVEPHPLGRSQAIRQPLPVDEPAFLAKVEPLRKAG